MFDWSAKEKIILPIMIVVLLIFAIGICLLTRNKSEKIKRLPLFIITIIILALEVAKQIYNLCIGYDLWAIPLHFCSLFMFFYSFSNFGKGKLRRFGDIMTVCCTFLVIVLFYLNPSNIIGESCENVFANFSNFHTFTYEHLLFLYYFIFLGSNLIVAKFSDLIYIIIGISSYAVVAITFAFSLNVNFCSILHNSFAPLEAIRTACGNIVYLICLFAVGILASCAVYIVFTILNRKINIGKIKEP